MSQATQDLITSVDVLIAVAVSAVVIVALAAFVLVKRHPFAYGGILIAGSAVVALFLTNEVPRLPLLGLVALAGAGWVPAKSIAVRMLTLVPGASLLGMSFTGSPEVALGGIVVVLVVLAAPLAANFDERYRESGISVPLVSVSMLAVFVTVPDTDVAVVVAASAVPWIFAGPPARLALLSLPGAFATTGLVIWVVASGGFSRSDSLITGVATLGLLVAEPTVRFIRSVGRTRLDRLLSAGIGGIALIVVVQGSVGLLLGQLIGGSGLGVLLAAIGSGAILALAGVWASWPKPDR